MKDMTYLKGKETKRGSARQVPDLLSTRALSYDTRLPRRALIARPLRHVGGAYAHALLFSEPSVQVGKNCLQWWKRRLGEAKWDIFGGRLLRHNGQSLYRTSDGAESLRQKIEKFHQRSHEAHRDAIRFLHEELF